MKRTASESPADSSYEKVSATLDRNVLRMIRERTSNVSGFLNDAAKDKLYFQMLRDADAELERQGVGFDEKLYAGLMRWTKARERRLARAARRKRTG